MLRINKIAKQLIKPNQDFTYSVQLDDKRPVHTSSRRNVLAADKLLSVGNAYNNLAELWDQIVAQFGSNKALQNVAYSEVDQLCKYFGSWLMKNKHQKVYIYSKNCLEWSITDLASWNYGSVTIPLYDTLGPQAFGHIVKLTEGTAILTSRQMVGKLVEYFSKGNQGKIKQIVFFDDFSKEDAKKFLKFKVKITKFADTIQNCEILPRPSLNLDSHLTYSFTSGTTGMPKGVICTHRNLISQLMGMVNFIEYKESDVHMSYLPIAHIFERYVIWMCLFFGCNIQYSKHSAAQILKDLAVIKPTVIPIVPRLLNKLYPIAKDLYEKEGNVEPVKQLFGGRLRSMITASAPVAAEILTFFKGVLQCQVRQAYGQTETTALSFVTNPLDTNYGHVGGPNPSLQMKLVDVPQMNYTTDSNLPKGQICLRGESIFIGYYKDPKNTKENIDSEGWSHTGDIGMFLPNGALKIIDRKKNIYKLSQGQYVAPEKIENIYMRCKEVAECFVYGDSRKDYNIAIIHPNMDKLNQIALDLNIKNATIEQLCNDIRITEQVHRTITEEGKRYGLFGFELAKKIRLWPISFANYGIFTSTMKLQRHIAKKAFEHEISSLYMQPRF